MKSSELIKIHNTVKVSRVIYHNSASNWGVFSYVNDNNFDKLTDVEVKVSGNFSNLFEGTEVEIFGEIVEHPTYGPQISLQSYKVISSSDSKQGIIEFLTKSTISGIALANATKIYEKFGKNSIEVVLHQTELIKTIDGIGEKTYRKVLKSVNKYKEQEELLNFCNELGGIPYSVIDSLFSTFGVNAVTMLKKDPYGMLAKSNLSFKQIDNIANRMGIPIDHDSRLKVGLLYVLKNESTLKGSTGCGFQELKKSFVKELGLADHTLYQYTLDLLAKEYKVIIEFNQVFLTEFYEAERNISEYLTFCRTTQIDRDYDPNIVEEEINNFPFTLNSQQVHAIKSCLENKFNIITGQGGVGKSSITKALVNILDRHKENVILLSPTGKASKRLAECTGRHAMTVHRYLGVKDSVENTDPDIVPFRTTILIDEASMLDVLLFEKVIASANSDTRLILVGDTHQLPSVQAGNVLEDIINSKLFNVCTLTDIMRQAEHSNIIKYCAKVNNNESFTPIKTSDFIYLKSNNREQILNTLLPLYKKAVEVYGLQETQLICPYKLGQLGIKNLNTLLKAEINSNPVSDKFPFSVGDKVKHIKNNYDKKVFNGETGVVLSIKLAEDNFLDVDEDTLVVDFGDRQVEYTKKDIHELTLSYASTVHASQGSEYKAVFVILDNEVSNILLIRKIIYTALSRARQKCILLSTGNCVDTAIHNDFYKERITKLGEFLVGEINEYSFN